MIVILRLRRRISRSATDFRFIAISPSLALISFTAFRMTKNRNISKNRTPRGVSCQTVKNASQNFVRKDETKSNLFFAPACTKRKIQIGLQVWNLFAECGQIMRAADLLAHRVSGGF